MESFIEILSRQMYYSILRITDFIFVIMDFVESFLMRRTFNFQKKNLYGQKTWQSMLWLDGTEHLRLYCFSPMILRLIFGQWDVCLRSVWIWLKEHLSYKMLYFQENLVFQFHRVFLILKLRMIILMNLLFHRSLENKWNTAKRRNLYKLNSLTQFVILSARQMT